MAGDLYLVTGGAGFIGSNLVDTLVARRDRVRVLDDLSTGSRANLGTGAGGEAGPSAVELVEGDVRDPAAVAAAAEGCRFVVHLAAQVSVPASMVDPLGTHEINASGTLVVLEAARRAGAERVVNASTCAVYGEEPTLPKREAMDPDPLSPYAASKLAGEAYAASYTKGFGLDVVSLRFFNVYGPRQDPTGAYASVIPKFVTRWLAGETPTVFGDGTQTRDFVYVDNVVEAITKACVAHGAAGRAVNVGTGVETSVNELIEELSSLLGRELAVLRGPTRAGDVKRSLADISRARTVLGYEGAVSLREGLARTVAYYSERAR